MKMIASQGSKIAIQSIGSITGHLSDGKHASSSFKKKNPSRQGVLLISYIFYVLTRLQHLENRAHCAEANLARAVEDIHQLSGILYHRLTLVLARSRLRGSRVR